MKQALVIAARDFAGIFNYFKLFLNQKNDFNCFIDFCIAVHYLPEGNEIIIFFFYKFNWFF